MSDLYAREVPLYKTLTSMVQKTNKQIIEKHPELGLNVRDIEVISAERHGAIRLGKPQELYVIAKIFRIMAMYPVDFYDLTKSGAKRQPVISTSFRPISLDEIEKSSFRMFVSLLQPDDRSFFTEDIGKEIKKNIAHRSFFSTKLQELIVQYENDGGFTEETTTVFIEEAAKIFTWSRQANNRKLYNYLMDNGLAIAADISCFNNPHLNHLTPNSLDISKLYEFMSQEIPDNLKDSIEGPPARNVRILLRQTSYKAVVEEVIFTDESGEKSKGSHKARFGEIEERGMAMTSKGKKLYENALKRYMENNDVSEFSVIPDNYTELYKQKLGYYIYAATSQTKDKGSLCCDIDELIANGDVILTPLRYEDFLPVSAAGIFASNLENYGVEKRVHAEVDYRKEQLEEIIGQQIYDSFDIYGSQSAQSLMNTYQQLGVWEQVTNKQEIQEKIKPIG
ncbi:2-oxoadipate dioxygenase/decarboxylase family protein [Candidatus Uabimicrobium sp. HlEnr_7]|uniref:2-oxoadipate dioxygenase/decarboxylase family protein n=1 Tax=Candidatus Uabimicrobium helgolandensis TaxID=3095367 RepID=UPI003558AEE7